MESLSIASILFFLTFALYSLLVVFILTWVYHDAESRGIMGWVVVIPTFMTGTIFGTVLWLVFRPSLKPDPVLVRSRER
ncbi:hypothetical protein [Pontibacter roseus]|uniref:hypothetical protein n=1 Tax=Pontibacter roseus TaxID=336989 RepID=UPI000527671A|nr:hypothetical protein [Pontibacter roseus]